MWYFLLIVLSVYGAMNSYFYWKVTTVAPPGRLRYAVAGWQLLMIAGPFIVRYLDKAGQIAIARAFGMVCYSWLAVMFWFLCLALLTDVYNLAVRGTSLINPAAAALHLPARMQMGGVGALVLLAVIWSVFEAQNIQPEYLTIRTRRLPPGAKPITLVQVSDLHLGVNTDGWRFDRTMRIIREAAPDALIATGDIVDSELDDLAAYAEGLAGIHPPLGKFAVLGNHEYYAGLKGSLEFYERTGFVLLRQQSRKAADGLLIAGVDDPSDGRGSPSLTDETAALPARAANEFVLLLKHRPSVNEASLGKFDLQLSGHTHGGQIFPFCLITRRVFPYYRGRHDLAGGSIIYANRGAGTWGPPMRLFARPEVTIIRIEPE